MARRTTASVKPDGTSTTASATKKATTPKEKPLNLDERVTVRNLAGWKVSFMRKHDGEGDIKITQGGQQRLSRNEIQAQINDGNTLFVGTGDGSHATLYIEDAATRKWVGFEDENRPQLVFTDDLVDKLFSMSQTEFETNLPIYISTRAEKFALIEAIRRLGFNDHRKIVFAENHTGFKI